MSQDVHLCIPGERGCSQQLREIYLFEDFCVDFLLYRIYLVDVWQQSPLTYHTILSGWFGCIRGRHNDGSSLRGELHRFYNEEVFAVSAHLCQIITLQRACSLLYRIDNLFSTIPLSPTFVYQLKQAMDDLQRYSLLGCGLWGRDLV